MKVLENVGPLVMSILNEVATAAVFVLMLALPVVVVLLARHYLKKDCFAEIEYAYATDNEKQVIPCKYTNHKNKLESRKLDFNLPVDHEPKRWKNKPLYEYYCPEPGVFVPLQPMEEESITIKTEDGKKEVPVKHLIPKVGHSAKQMYEEAFKESNELYEKKSKIKQLILEYGPHILTWILLFLIVWQLSEVAANLGSINIPDKIELVKSAADNVTRSPPTLP